MEFYTVDELSKILKIHTRTVLQLIYDKKIRATKVARDWRIERIDLEIYLKNNENIERAVLDDYFKKKE